jgi:Cft2 family RNA processing exonuclease
MIQITPLAGCGTVDQAAVHIELGGCGVLVDAGLPLDAAARERVLELLGRELSLDLILLTHAHPLNVRGLSALVGRFPGVPVRASGPTLELLALGGIEAPAAEALPLDEPVACCGGRLRVTAYRAGHALGTRCFFLESEAGTVFVVGDLGSPTQLAVADHRILRVLPDAVVVQSFPLAFTPAGRMEEETWIGGVIDRVVVGREGKLLFPLAAFGRAQELILALQRLRLRGLLRAPVHVDGVIPGACALHVRHPEEAAAHLQRLLSRHEDPFFARQPEIRAVESAEDRRRILDGPPCCIVTTPPDLERGPAAEYSRALAGDPRNGVALHVAADDESAEPSLARAARGEDGEGASASPPGSEARWSVETYPLTTHAPVSRLCALLSRLRAGTIVLARGSRDRRREIALQLGITVKGEVVLPEDGETVFAPAPARQRLPLRSGQVRTPLGGEEPLDLAGVSRLHAFLLRERLETRIFTVADLLRIWSGEGNFGTREVAEASAVVARGPWFRTCDRYPLLALPVEANPEDSAGPHRVAPALARRLVRELLPAETGLERIRLDEAAGAIQLRFPLPALARSRHAATFASLERLLGWRIETAPGSERHAVHAALRAVLPAGVHPTYIESLPGESTVRVQLDRDLSPEEQQALGERFLRATGLTLQVIPTEPAMAREARSASAAPSERRPSRRRGVLEELERELERLVQPPPRVRWQRGGTGRGIEVAFITPEMGARHRPLLDELERRVGRPISIRPTPNPGQLSRLVEELIPEDWRLQRPPSILQRIRSVRIAPAHQPEQAEIERISQRFRELTGWTLLVEP